MRPKHPSADVVRAAVRPAHHQAQLEDGVPTDVYTLEEAVKQGWLVAPRAVDVPEFGDHAIDPDRPLGLVDADLMDEGLPNAVQVLHRGVDEADRFVAVPDVVVPVPDAPSFEGVGGLGDACPCRAETQLAGSGSAGSLIRAEAAICVRSTLRRLGKIRRGARRVRLVARDLPKRTGSGSPAMIRRGSRSGPPHERVAARTGGQSLIGDAVESLAQQRRHSLRLTPNPKT